MIRKIYTMNRSTMVRLDRSIINGAISSDSFEIGKYNYHKICDYQKMFFTSIFSKRSFMEALRE
jgi:hypothetical protein